MKKLNLFSNLWSSLVGSQCSDIGVDRRLTVGSPSGRYASANSARVAQEWLNGSSRLRVDYVSITTRLRVCPLKLVSVLAILLTIGVGDVWGADVDSGTSKFTTVSGSLDTYISYASAKAGGTNAPVTNSSNIRLYRNNTSTAELGSTLTVSASGGAKITSITFTLKSSLGYSISVDGGAATTGTASSVSKSSINATSVTLQNYSASQMDVKRIQVTYTAPTPCTITWHVNSGTTTAGSPTTNSTTGSKVTTLPTAPASAACDGSKVFVGWTETAIVGTTNTKPSDLFINASGAPTLTQTATHYYAVFADEDVDAATVTFGWESADDATNWTLSNLSSKATYSDYKSSGSYAGSNGSSTTASIKFNNKISPTAISCKYTKATTNTNSSSKFIIQTSSDGSSWTDKVNGKTMNNVTQGTFETLSWSGTLSDVYVRIYLTTTATTRVIDEVSITYSSTTYSNYATSCCDELASINGSVSWSNGSKATLIWDKDANATGYVVKWKTHAGADNTYATTNVSTINDTLTTKKTCAIPSLTAGNEYDFRIFITGKTSPTVYCDDDSVMTATAPKITVKSAPVALSGSDYAEGATGGGTVKTFVVSGVGLTGALTFTAPTNFQVSTDGGSTWSTDGGSKTLAASGTLSETTIKVRLVEGLSEGTYGGATTYVTISGGGAAAVNSSVSVAGSVSAACHTPTISADPSDGTYNLNETPTALSVTAAKGDASDPTLTYQWKQCATSDGTYVNVVGGSGATTSSYTPPTSSAGTLYYKCVVSSGACTATSNYATFTVNTPTISIGDDKTSIAFGDRAKDGSYELTFTVSGSNLAKDAGISLALSGTNASLFSINKTSISQTSSGAVSSTTVTVTYSPNVAGDHSATLTISSSGATSKVLSLSGSSKWVVTWKVNGSTSTTTYVANSSKPVPPSAPANNTLNNCANKFVGWSCKSWGSTPKGTGTGEYDDLFTSSDYSTKGPSITKDTVLYAVFAESVGAVENTVMWSEDWTGATTATAASDVAKPSANCSTGKVVYGGASVTYSETSNGTYVRNENTGGGTKPELMLKKSEAWTISGIPSGGASALTVSYRQNAKSVTPSISGTGYSGGGSATSSAAEQSFDVTVGSTSTFSLTFTAGSGDNVRLDDISVKVKTAIYGNYITQCADNQVRVTYDFNGGSGTLCTSGVTTKNASYSVCSTSPTKMGYTFTGWKSSVDNNTYAASATYNLQASVTFTAQWTPKEYTITYKDKDDAAYSGDNSGSLVGTHTYGSGTDLVAGTRGHDRFEGWYTTSACTGDPITSIGATDITDNITLYAKWTARREIVFDIYGTGTTTIYRANDENLEAAASGALAGQGAKPSDPDAPSACSSKVFVGWTESEIDDETDTKPGDLTDATGKVNADKHYYSVWAISTGTAIAAVEDESFTGSGCESYLSSSYGMKDAGDYIIKNSIWNSSNMTNVNVLIKVKHVSNNAAETLRVSLVDSDGNEVVGTDLATTAFGTGNSSAAYSANVELTPTTSVTGYKVAVKTKGAGVYGTSVYAVTREVVPTLSALATSCCLTSVTLTKNSPEHGTITFGKSKVPTCDADQNVSLTITPDAGYQLTGWTVKTTTGYADAKTTSPAVVTNDNTSSVQNITLTFAEGANKDYDVTATFGLMTVSSWTWTMNSSSIPNPLNLYVGQTARLDVAYTPSGVDASKKTYTRTKVDAYINWVGALQSSYTTISGKASTDDNTTDVTFTHADGPTTTVKVKVLPLPLVHFVDLVHDIEFADVVATLEDNALSKDKFTPTYADQSGSGTKCEDVHLFLMGWIDGDWSGWSYLDTENGTPPDISTITGAGSGVWIPAGGAIDVDAKNGKTYYAVWGKENN